VTLVADQGAGFDMHHAEKMFGDFERLHRQDPVEGLDTVL
jgi:light-regulated signal transduction histidine kinase (bacteriophytochrome)